MDQEFYVDIGDLLGEATTWYMEVEEVYSRMEVHSINTTMGDVKDVGVFSDNVEKTVYLFMDNVENAYLTARTSRQKAEKLYVKHLSEEIKAKTVDISGDFIELKAWLVQNYSDVQKIVNDVTSGLTKKKRPGSRREKFVYFLEILSALGRLEKLRKILQVSTT